MTQMNSRLPSIDQDSPQAERAESPSIAVGRVPSANALSPLLTLFQVASFLSVSPKTVRRLIARGKLPCVRVGRVVRFQPADLFRFVEARKE